MRSHQVAHVAAVSAITYSINQSTAMIKARKTCHRFGLLKICWSED